MSKRLILLSLLVFSVATSVAQEQFQRVYGGESYDYGTAVIQMPDSGYMIAGSTGSFGLESGEVLLLRTDARGYEQWCKFYGGPFADKAESMDTTADGNLILAGFTERTGKSYQVFALKMTTDGDTLWSRHFGGELWDFAKQVIPLDDGGFAIIGQTYSYGAGDGDMYLLRLSSDGDTLWTRTYGGPQLESGESIALTAGGGFLLAGHTESFGSGQSDMYVILTDASGDVLWTKTYGGVEDDRCYAVTASNDGGFIIAGGTFSDSCNTTGGIYYKACHDGDDGNFMILKAGVNGDIEWIRIDDEHADEYWTDVIEDENGNITVVGITEESANGGDDARIMRINEDGNWDFVAVSYASGEQEQSFDVKQTSDDGYVMVGHTGGFLQRFDDVYLIKMDNNGQTAPAELAVNEIIIDDASYQVNISPNPFHGSPRIFIRNYRDLTTRLDGPIEFRLYNGLGQLIHETDVRSESTLLDVAISAGVYSYQLTSGGSLLATGVAIGLR